MQYPTSTKGNVILIMYYERYDDILMDYAVHAQCPCDV